MAGSVRVLSDSPGSHASIERLGGADHVMKELAASEKVRAVYDLLRESLIEKFPNRWAVVSKDGLVSVDSTLPRAVESAEEHGLRKPHYKIAYLNPNPPVLLL